MKISQISVQYHKELNPKLWDGMKLKQEVRQKLLQIVKEFIKFCDIPEFEPDVVYMTGSLCAYNYTSGSDVDVHIKLNFKNFDCPEIVEQMFDAKRDVFTDKFDITIYGFPVEVYVQDITDENIAAGEYDLIKDKWLERPQYSPPDVNGREIKQKSASLRRKIAKVVANEVGYKEAKGLMKRIKAWRKAALQDGGEFSSENLVFKALRKDGTISKLLDYIKTEKSEELSLEEGVEEFENNPVTLVQLYKAQAARTLEWCRLRDAMIDKYGTTDAAKLNTKKMQTGRSSDFTYPSGLKQGNIEEKDYNKLQTTFLRMIRAKQTYQLAGGNYDGWMTEGVEEFENNPTTREYLHRVQLARTQEWIRLLDHMLAKYKIDIPVQGFELISKQHPNNLRFPPVFTDREEISKEDHARLWEVFQRMIKAKANYFNK